MVNIRRKLQVKLNLEEYIDEKKEANDLMKKNFKLWMIVVLTIILSTIVVPVYSTKASMLSIKLNKSCVTLKIGETYQLKTNIADSSCTWKSSNKSIVTVSATGKLRAKKAGSATVTANINGKTAKCKVTVAKAPAWSRKTWKNKVSDWTMEFSSQYTTVFKSNGTVCQIGWRNKDTGYYRVLSGNKIKAYYTDNYVSWAGSTTPQKVKGYSYTVLYTYNKNTKTVTAKYSSGFYKQMLSNAQDGVLYSN